MDALETPGEDKSPDWQSLYLYRGEEVRDSRPAFTGDVYELPDGTRTVQLIQHPCAIRVDGVNLVPDLIATTVEPSSPLKPSQWKGNYKTFPLPDLKGDSTTHYSSLFHRPTLVSPVEIQAGRRIACLSQHGVNLLLQRWVHHNSRVVVPTWQVDLATSSQYEEADLVEEWGDEWEIAGLDPASASVAAHDWLRSDSGNGTRWQDLLESPQSRSKVRSAMRAELRKQASERQN